MNEPLKRAPKRFAGVALCSLGIAIILFYAVSSPTPYAYAHLVALAGAGACIAVSKPRALLWTAVVGFCLAAIVSATFLVFIDRESGIDWSHPSARLTIESVAISFGILFLSFAVGLRLWNAPADAAAPGNRV